MTLLTGEKKLETEEQATTNILEAIEKAKKRGHFLVAVYSVDDEAILHHEYHMWKWANGNTIAAGRRLQKFGNAKADQETDEKQPMNPVAEAEPEPLPRVALMEPEDETGQEEEPEPRIIDTILPRPKEGGD